MDSHVDDPDLAEAVSLFFGTRRPLRAKAGNELILNLQTLVLTIYDYLLAANQFVNNRRHATPQPDVDQTRPDASDEIFPLYIEEDGPGLLTIADASLTNGETAIAPVPVVTEKKKSGRKRKIVTPMIVGDDGDVVSTDEEGPEGETPIKRDFAAVAVEDDDSEVDDDEVEFLFEWHPCPINPMPLARTRQSDHTSDISDIIPSFDDHRCGSQVKILVPSTVTELDYFSLFITESDLTRWAVTTNANALKNKTRKWSDIDVRTMKTFIAIVIYLGLNKFASRKDAWDASFYGSRWVISMMPHYRFEQILSNWRWEDTTKLSEEEKKALKQADPFFSVKSWLIELRSRCTEAILHTFSRFRHR